MARFDELTPIFVKGLSGFNPAALMEIINAHATEGVPTMTDPLDQEALQDPPNSPPAGNYTVRHWSGFYAKQRERFMKLRDWAIAMKAKAEIAETTLAERDKELDIRDKQFFRIHDMMKRMLTVYGQLLQQFAIEPTPGKITYDPSSDGEGATTIMFSDGDWTFVIDGDAEETRAYHARLLHRYFALPHDEHNGLNPAALMAFIQIREDIDGTTNTGTTPKVIADLLVKPEDTELVDKIYMHRDSFVPTPRKVDPAILSLYANALSGRSRTVGQNANATPDMNS